MRVVDLCCGVGGWSTGLEQAGFPVTLAVDTWDLALKSHAANHPNAEHVRADVRELVGSIGRADVVVGSPPCQAFSSLGGKGVAADDSIIRACAAIAEEARARWCVLENVPKAEPVFKSLGLPTRILRASLFGLPHRRRRVFAGHFAPPLATGIRRETMLTPTATDGRRTAFSPAYLKKMGPKAKEWVQPTLEQNLAKMGFPPGYIVYGGKGHALRQVGNAVPPPVARAIAAAQRDDGHMLEEVAALG